MRYEYEIYKNLLFFYNIKAMNLDQEDYDYGYDEDYQDYNQYDYEEYNEPYQYDDIANNNPYEVLPQSSIMKQLKKAVQQTIDLVALPYGWSLLLLRQFKWNNHYVPQYFQNPDKYKQKIHYSSTYKNPEEVNCDKVDMCMICCENVRLVENICGESFCEKCWIGHIGEHVKTMNPFMKCMGCATPLPHEVIMKLLGLSPEYDIHKTRYQKLLCEEFSSQNKSYQCCPAADCTYCIKCEDYNVATVKCMCGKIFCFRCGNDDHSPCSCEERKKWLDTVMKEEADAKWMALNTKLCPSCSKPVERSAGCNYMACVCGKSFCYMCSQPWEPDHKDHFRCHIYKKKPDEQVNKEKAILEKMNFFAEKYLNTNQVSNDLKKIDTFEKRKLLFEILNIDLSESDFIDQAYKFAIQCCDSLKWIYVYRFYVKFTSQEKNDYFDFSQGQYEKYKENLLKKLSFDLKNFLSDLEKKRKVGQKININIETENFIQLKKNITNYFKCTKQFKDKFVSEIQRVDLSLIKRCSEENMEKKNSKEEKAQIKKKKK